jgi:hypothetical protein
MHVLCLASPVQAQAQSQLAYSTIRQHDISAPDWLIEHLQERAALM